MQDGSTLDLFALADGLAETAEPVSDNEDDGYYGESAPVIEYNKAKNRQHTEDTIYFARGNQVFHHVTR